MRNWSTISKPTPAGEQITMLSQKPVVNCCRARIIKGWNWKGNWESSRNWKGGSGFFEISSSLCLWPPLEPGSRPDNGLGAVWHSAPLWRRLCVPLCPSVHLSSVNPCPASQTTFLTTKHLAPALKFDTTNINASSCFNSAQVSQENRMTKS